MAFNFKESAKRLGAVEDDLIADKTKAKLDTIVGEVVTLRGIARTRFDKDGEKGAYPAIVFEEYPDNFFSGGTLFERAIYGWAEEMGCEKDDDPDCPYCDFTPVNEELKHQSVKLTFFKSVKRNGQPLNKFKFI